MSNRVSITTSDHIAHVTLTRADKINALDSAMFDAIISAIAELAVQPDLRAVVVSGEGRGFCAGLDMASLQGDAAPTKLLERTHGVTNRFQQVAWGWRTLPVPEDPLARAMLLAHEIVGKNPDAIRAAKRLSNALAHISDEELLLAESREQDDIIGQANQTEAVMAQMEGRAPRFS